MPKGLLVASADLDDDGRVVGTGKIPGLGDEEGVEGVFHRELDIVKVDGGFGEVGVEPGAGGEGFG